MIKILKRLIQKWRNLMTIEEQIASLVQSVANLTTQVDTVATSVAALVKAQATPAPVTVDLSPVETSLTNLQEQLAATATIVQGLPAQLTTILADITVAAPAAAGTDTQTGT
jgi:hypothetical protein